jgi:hypothetical protein
LIYFLKYFEKETKHLIITFLAIGWALVASFHSITKKDKTIVLQINGFDTRVVEESSRPPIEVENFFHNFVGLFYSYTTSNYEDHMNRASTLIKLSLLREYSPKINSMFDKIQLIATVQSSHIQKISKIGDLDYEIDLNVNRVEGDNERKNDYRLRMRVERVKRTTNNPYGLEVTNLEEIYE